MKPQLRSLSEFCSIKHGFAFSSSQFGTSGTHIVVSPGNFHEEGGFRENGSEARYYTAPVPGEYVLAQNDLLVVMTEQKAGLLGSTALIPASGRYLHNQRLGLVTGLNEAELDRNFLYHVLNSQPVRQQISVTAGGTKVRHSSPDKILAVTFCWLPLPEQKKIAAILTSWEQAIELIGKLVAAKQQQKADLMQRLLTGKVRLPGFTEQWSSAQIEQFLTESRLAGSAGDSARKLTVKLYGKGVIPKADIRPGSSETKYYRRRAGQFIYSKLDFLNGAFGLIPPELDGYESTLDLPAFDVGKEVDPRWFLYFVTRKSFYKTGLSMANGGRKARRVNPHDFLKSEIPLPHRQEQTAIADVIGTATQEIDLLNRKLDALRRQKKGLMQQLLTGRVRVRLDEPPGG
jgi:type I restriction enzyme, S subunit